VTDDLSYYQELADKIYSKQALEGLSTGYSDLDALSGGLKAGELLILGGTTGTGKSLLALNILVNLAKRGIEVDYYDLENSAVISHQRLVSIWTGKPKEAFTEKREEAAKAMCDYTEYINYFDHEFLKTKEKPLFNRVLEFMAVSKARVMLVDPLQSLEEEIDGGRILNEQGKYTRYLKELAQRKQKTVIVCHHMRKSMARAGEWVTDLEDPAEQKYQIPSLEDMRGSGKITDYATDVWGIVRTSGSKTKAGRGSTMLRVLKNRTGLKGDVKMFFDEDNLQFHQTTKATKESIMEFFGSHL